MKIAVDARELAAKPTGVGRYLSALVECWTQSPEAQRHEWLFYTPHHVTSEATRFGRWTTLPGSGGTRWEQWTLSRALARDRPDVLFAPAYSAPLMAPCPVALTIHDVSFAAHPEWFSRREGTRRRAAARWSARRARVVLTDTEFSRGEIVRHLGIPAEKIRVVPLGATTIGEATRNDAREPIVLFVGSLFRRRHVDTLIEAFLQSVAPAVPGSRLEIVGENRLYPAWDPAQRLRAAPPELASRVSLRSYVDEPVLRDLYRRAAVFAFLSEYEGFGLTPLEALAAGVPSVVLDTPVAREVYGPAAHYVRDVDPKRVGEALIALLTSAEARGAVLRHANDVLARYSWPRAADATLHALREAAGA